MIYQTSKSTEQEDQKFGVADYDFFRYRSWHAMVFLIFYDFVNLEKKWCILESFARLCRK